MTPENRQEDPLFNGSMAVLVVLFAIALMLTYKWYDAGRTVVARPTVPAVRAERVIPPDGTTLVPETMPRPAAPPVVDARKSDTAPVAPPVLQEPTFDTVRVEKSGDAVIAGRAAPDASVTVQHNGTVVATARSSADGSFVAIPAKPLPTGTGQLTLEARAGTGPALTSRQSIIVAVPEQKTTNAPLVALVKPGQNLELLQAPAAVIPGAVSLDSVDYDEKGAMLFSGHAPANSLVRLYANNTPVGEARATEKGLWQYRDENRIAAGTFSLRLDALNSAGKVLSRTEMPVTRTPASQTAEPASKDGRITIQPGNNLWTLSRVIYGRGTHFTVIYNANRTAIIDPDKIYPGQVLAVPGANPPAEIPAHIRKPLAPPPPATPTP